MTRLLLPSFCCSGRRREHGPSHARAEILSVRARSLALYSAPITLTTAPSARCMTSALTTVRFLGLRPLCDWVGLRPGKGRPTATPSRVRTRRPALSQTALCLMASLPPSWVSSTRSVPNLTLLRSDASSGSVKDQRSMASSPTHCSASRQKPVAMPARQGNIDENTDVLSRLQELHFRDAPSWPHLMHAPPSGPASSMLQADAMDTTTSEPAASVEAASAFPKSPARRNHLDSSRKVLLFVRSSGVGPTNACPTSSPRGPVLEGRGGECTRRLVFLLRPSIRRHLCTTRMRSQDLSRKQSALRGSSSSSITLLALLLMRRISETRWLCLASVHLVVPRLSFLFFPFVFLYLFNILACKRRFRA